MHTVESNLQALSLTSTDMLWISEEYLNIRYTHFPYTPACASCFIYLVSLKPLPVFHGSLPVSAGCKYECHAACRDRVSLDCHPAASPFSQDQLNNNNTLLQVSTHCTGSDCVCVRERASSSFPVSFSPIFHLWENDQMLVSLLNFAIWLKMSFSTH